MTKLLVSATVLATVVGCSHRARPPEVTGPPEVTASSTLTAGSPLAVVVVTSTAPCGGEAVDSPTTQLLQKDALDLEESFRRFKGRVVRIQDPTEDKLKADIDSLPPDSRLFFVYSGHGRVTFPSDSGAQHPESALCLGAADAGVALPLPVRTLLGWIQERAAQTVVVLSACQSAFVDVSRASRLVSVITVSPEDVLESDIRPGASTHVVAALLDALSTGAQLDTSCDGWVSDRELFEATAGRLRTQIPFVERSAIMPRLRRQANAPLQLWPAADASGVCKLRLASVRLLIQGELADQMERRVSGEGQERVPRDYFFLQDPTAHASCAGSLPGMEPLPARLSGALGEMCRLAKEAGLHPLPLPTPMPKGAGCEAVECARLVAKTVDFAEVYFFHTEESWIHLDRLRDGRRLLTRRDKALIDNFPQKQAVVARWEAGDFLARFSGVVPGPDAGVDADLARLLRQPERTVAVCAESEGQCFYSAAEANQPTAIGSTSDAQAPTQEGGVR